MGAQLPVAVLNGSVTSAPVNLEVDNPAPTIASVAPTSEAVGATAAVITVSGTGFVPSTVINVNGAARTTTFISAMQVSVALSAADVASVGSLSLTAVNLTPGGGTSGAAPVAVIAANPAPTIASTSPSSVVVGASAPVVTVTGAGFVSSTVIQVNGSARATSYISATQVSVTLSAADVSSAGSLSLTAVNPGPGGGASGAIALPVNNPTIGTLQLSPSTLPVGSASPTTVTVTGNTFVPTSVVQINGAARATTYVNSTTLTFQATVADQAHAGTLYVTVTNPAPGGGTSPAASLAVTGPPATPTITAVSPSSIVAGSGDTLIVVSGTGFTTNSVIQWNGTALNTTLFYYPTAQLDATVPAADLTTAGTASVTVNTPTATPSLSNAFTVNLTNPPAPTLTSIYPAAGPINTPIAVALYGTGFTTQTTLAVNGETITTQYVSSTNLTATIPAFAIASPGNFNVTVTTPAPGGGTSAALSFTTYINIPNNDIVYNATDGLIYASVPISGDGVSGNSVAGIDPATGNVMRQIWVGSNPNKVALSSDGTQLFVGLDGAAGIAQVDLTQGKVVNQFSLGGGQGVYNPPLTALYLAAVPGSPNSVAIATAAGLGNQGSGITIYDSGVARANTWSSGEGPMSFGASATTLYVLSGSTVEQLTLSASGVTAATALTTSAQSANWLQYDRGSLYLSSGQVLNASTGGLQGTFYSTATSAANGPIVSDSTLGRAFMAVAPFGANASVLAFDETSFNQIGSIPFNDSSGSFTKIVRWGQNGIAFNAPNNYVNNYSAIFSFHSPLVKDISSTPADLSVSLTAPTTATTGAAVSWVATVSNLGPNAAVDATLALDLDSSLIINSITPSQGSCGTGPSVNCDLGGLANGASATVTISATPTAAATLAGSASVSSVSYDPTTTNNQATTSTTVTGTAYGAVPAISAISPNLVQAGGADFTLTVSGLGFNANSTVYLNTTALSTTYVSATQLTASVTADQIANYGWTAISVSNPMPGGGISQMVPLTIYKNVNVPASALLFDPWGQMLYATIPSTATSITGNSVVAIEPFTGTVGAPVNVGSQPTVMAETSDGNYLYISLSGADSLAQFNLLNQSLTATIPVALTQYGSTTNVAATWLAAMPGSDTTLAVDLTNGWGQFGIFDISGSTGTFRTNLSGIYDGVDPVFADASHLYAYDSQTSGAEFYRYTINANGLTLVDGTTLDGMGGFGGSIQLAGGLVYSAGGGIVNPSTTPPSQVATLQGGSGLAADPSLGKEFLMLGSQGALQLTRYNLASYLPEAMLQMPSSLLNSFTSGWTMLRFGQDGMALFYLSENYGTGQTTASLMLLRGPFIVPQELGTSTAATLASSSASTIAHGSGNTLFTLTGSSFLPGVAVTWNGGYRTTMIVDATHVTVNIPASDLASTGTASLVATNPGAAASNSLQITIN